MNQNKKFKLSAQKKADILLIIFIIAILISYPFHKTLLGGLFFSFVSAGLIGGIADWFAIKSFFTKPLGISWPEALFKTEMIPKNRVEVISVIVDIVQDKVITRAALGDMVKQTGISKLLIDYIIEHRILNTTAEELLKKVDISSIQNNQKQLRKIALNTVEQNKSEINEAVNHLVYWAISKGYIHSILCSITPVIQTKLKQPEVYNNLSILITNIKNRCYHNQVLRLSAINFLSKFNDIPMELLKKADSYLEKVKDPEYVKKSDVTNIIEQLAKHFTISSLHSFINTSDIKAFYGEAVSAGPEGTYNERTIQDTVDNWVNKLNSMLRESTDISEKLNTELDIRLSDFLYEQIKYIIKNKLEEYSNEMLTEEIYNSVGEDLNMVRLNGSIVGGVVGIITYTIMFIAG